MKKVKGKVIALIIAIVVVLGASAGIMYAFGVFSSEKTKAFELLEQVPAKLSYSAQDKYLGNSEMMKAMLDKGMGISLKYSDIQMDMPDSLSSVLSKLTYNFDLQIDHESKKARINMGAGADGSDINLQAYASLDDKKIVLAAPELLKNKAFTLTGDDSDSQVQKLQDLIKHLPELKDNFMDYLDQQGKAVYDGMTCEKTENGYRLTIPKDVVDAAINSLSDFAKDQKDNLRELEELFGAKEGDIAGVLDKILPQITAETVDMTFDVYGERGNLTGVKAGLKDKSGNELVSFDLAFEEKGEQSSMSLTVSAKQEGNELGTIEIKTNSTDGGTCTDTISYKVEMGGRVLMQQETTTSINKETNELTIEGKSSAAGLDAVITAKGSIKNLTKGKCVTYQLDEVNVDTGDDMGKFSFAAELTEGVLEGEVVAPEGEEIAINEDLAQTFESKYVQEASLSLMAILSKWGVDLEQLANSYVMEDADSSLIS